MIGDSVPRDVAGARNAGLRSIWIDRGQAWSRADEPVRRTRGSSLSARSGRPSPRWGLAPLLLEARPDLVGLGLDVRREDEHHVEEIGQLADRSLASLAAQRRRGLARLLHELRRDRVGSGFEQLAEYEPAGRSRRR